MSAINTITVLDAETTPVSHDFTPSQINGDMASYNEKSATSAQGFWPLTLTLRRPQTNGTGARVFRSQVNLGIPVIESVNGVDSVTRTLRANVEFILPENSSLQERKNLRKLLVEILSDAQVTDVVENLNNVY